MRFPVRASVIPAVLVICGTAAAQNEYIVMANGDRITGEIKQIWDAELVIEPAYADEFAVDMADIVEIVSDREFDLEFADGTELTARPEGVDESGRLLLAAGDEVVTRDLAELEELDEIDEYFDWDSRIDSSVVINEGNTTSRTLRTTANTNLKLGDHRHIGDLTIAEESQDGETTKQQSLLVYNYNWLFRDAMFLAATTSYERDPVRNLDKRFILGAGVGWEIWDDAGKRFTIQGGLGQKTEDIDDVDESNAIAFWGLRFSYDITSDLDFYHTQSIDSTLSGRRNTVAKTSTGMRYEISDLLYLNFEVAYDYESHPAAGAENEDLAILAGFGLEF